MKSGVELASMKAFSLIVMKCPIMAAFAQIRLAKDKGQSRCACYFKQKTIVDIHKFICIMRR